MAMLALVLLPAGKWVGTQERNAAQHCTYFLRNVCSAGSITARPSPANVIFESLGLLSVLHPSGNEASYLRRSENDDAEIHHCDQLGS